MLHKISGAVVALMIGTAFFQFVGLALGARPGDDTTLLWGGAIASAVVAGIAAVVWFMTQPKDADDEAARIVTAGGHVINAQRDVIFNGEKSGAVTTQTVIGATPVRTSVPPEVAERIKTTQEVLHDNVVWWGGPWSNVTGTTQVTQRISKILCPIDDTPLDYVSAQGNHISAIERARWMTDDLVGDGFGRLWCPRCDASYRLTSEPKRLNQSLHEASAIIEGNMHRFLKDYKDGFGST